MTAHVSAVRTVLMAAGRNASTQTKNTAAHGTVTALIAVTASENEMSEKIVVREVETGAEIVRLLVAVVAGLMETR